MSRIGKKPILILQGVDVKIDGQRVTVKGPRGELFKEVPPEIGVALEDGKLVVRIGKETKKIKALWGLVRALLAGMIKGVTEGYEKKLEIEGVGFRASVEGDSLVLNVGFFNPVKIKAPEGVKFSVEKNIIIVSGINKESVGQTAAKIRAAKPAEPYKGKGIKYLGEQIRRKLGKKAVATAK
ncbi:MAG: 50S ribosomal protein L6 [Candidatus Nealsonbacteria bacterium]|nr:50S ribosomal protein L6 [Candidatus Nealsonbacteria bacterium]